MVELDALRVEWVLADAQRIKQVLLNLVGNAIKFTERGGVVLRLESGKRMSHRRSFTSRCAIRASVFRPKRWASSSNRSIRCGQAESPPRGDRAGPGDQSAHRQGDGRQDRSRERAGKGITFAFDVTLSFDPSFVPVQVEDSAPIDLDGEGTLSGRVMVVEDNEVNRMIAREVLFSLGVDVVEAGDGKEAIDLLDEQAVDLVLMDCEMPVMTGTRRRSPSAARRRRRQAAPSDRCLDGQCVRRRRGEVANRRHGRAPGQALHAGAATRRARQVADSFPRRCALERAPLRDARSLLVPGAIELESLDLVDRARWAPPALRTCARAGAPSA
jgi:hypothetical protein